MLLELKKRARAEGKTLGCLMSELLARAVRAPQPTERPKIRFYSKPRHLKIDLEDKDALWALLDADDDLRG